MLREGGLFTIEEACASRGGEKVCLDRASLPCREVPNMRGTVFALEAR
jgi:hypothetical protein